MRTERQANLAITKCLDKQNESTYSTRLAKAQRIMAMPQAFAFRLAALVASDTNKGQMWC